MVDHLTHTLLNLAADLIVLANCVYLPVMNSHMGDSGTNKNMRTSTNMGADVTICNKEIFAH